MFLNQETSDADSKFSVTSILSSMASGQLLTPTSYSMVNFLASGSGTTPTLTPTTLVSLEQTFTELQSAAQAGDGGAASGTGPAGCEPPTQSGFVPPIVDPSSQEQSQDSFDSSDAEWELSPAKRARGSHGGSSSVLSLDGSSPSSSSSAAPQRKYTRRSRHEKLSPEEERRRAVRRERNKLAAAKCRQRRVDHTNSLVEETEKLEAEKSDLENEIHSLQQQRDQLEFILQAHVPVCKVDPMAKMNFKIKAEPEDFSMNATACSSHHHPPPSSTSRPKSLPLDKNGDLPAVVSCAGPGIALSTPSSGLFTFTSLDSLVDGSTGLTPLTAGPVSCSSQVHRSENESGADAVTSPTLISL